MFTAIVCAQTSVRIELSKRRFDKGASTFSGETAAPGAKPEAVSDLVRVFS
jgi:hypothetical protein